MAFAITALLAVAGWVVAQQLARRSLRRTMSIEYLLAAYRRLESASNRLMTEVHDAALESAIADIQLLGSPTQVAMASDFARAFAANQQADTGPLLDDLRDSLRKELLLQPVNSTRTLLRISRSVDRPGPQITAGSWTVWAQQGERVRASLGVVSMSNGMPTSPIAISELPADGAENLLARPGVDAISVAHQRLGRQLSEMANAAGISNIDSLNATELAYRAFEEGLITEVTRNAVEGLGVMHTLALLKNHSGIDSSHVQEYLELTEATLFALRMPK